MARKATAAPAQQAKAATARGAPKVASKPVKATSKAGAKAPVAAATARGRAKAAPAKTKAAPPPPPKPATVTLKHLAAGLSESRGVPKRDAEAFATDLIGGLLDQVKAGAKVRIAGLGVIEVKDRPARTARNPATGAPVQVAASRKVVFRVAKDLKDAI